MEDTSKILGRIEKLLALAGNNPSKEEAMRAAEHAAQLMARHHIDQATLESSATESEPIAVEPIEVLGRRCVSWKGLLSSGIALANGCRMYWSGRSSNDEVVGALRRSGPPGRGICIVGRRSDIEVVAYLYAYFSREIGRLADEAWAEHRSGGERSRTYKNNFRIAAAREVILRLQEAQAQAVSEARESDDGIDGALVHIDERRQALDRFYGGLNLRRGRGSSFGVSAAGQDAGRNAGRKLGLPGAGIRSGVGPRRLRGR